MHFLTSIQEQMRDDLLQGKKRCKSNNALIVSRDANINNFPKTDPFMLRFYTLQGNL